MTLFRFDPCAIDPPDDTISERDIDAALDLLVERVMDGDADAVRATHVTQTDILAIALSFGAVEEFDEPLPAVMLLDDEQRSDLLNALLSIASIAAHVDRRLRVLLERTSANVIDDLAIDRALGIGDNDAAYDDFATGGSAE